METLREADQENLIAPTTKIRPHKKTNLPLIIKSEIEVIHNLEQTILTSIKINQNKARVTTVRSIIIIE